MGKMVDAVMAKMVDAVMEEALGRGGRVGMERLGAGRDAVTGVGWLV
ncbi:hypothetical protein [Bifidobacterium minimum]|nr:hypothetical protein [Bifidobacterium minimum]